MGPSPVPLPGLTDSHAGAVLSAIAVQFSVLPPLFDIVMFWVTGPVPTTLIKPRVAAEIRIVGGGGVTVRVTSTTWGEFTASTAAMFMVLV